MKKLILAALVAASCAAAQAEWTKLGTGKSGGDTSYVDATTVRRQSSRAKVWALTDYKSAQVGGRGTKYRSQKAQLQFDCREETFETTIVMYMSGQMGEGESVHTDTLPMVPIPVPPNSTAAALMEIACSAPGDSGSARSSGASGSYAARIAAAVRPNIVYPDVDQVSGNPTAEFDVSLAADGAIVGVNLRKSSGVTSWDDAAERGLRRTVRLPRDIDGRIYPAMVVVLRPKG